MNNFLCWKPRRFSLRKHTPCGVEGNNALYLPFLGNVSLANPPLPPPGRGKGGGYYLDSTVLPLVELFNCRVLELGAGYAPQGRSLTLVDNVAFIGLRLVSYLKIRGTRATEL